MTKEQKVGGKNESRIAELTRLVEVERQRRRVAESRYEEAKRKLEKVKEILVVREMPEEKRKPRLKDGAIYLDEWMLADDGVFAELPREIFHMKEVKYISRYGIQQVRTQLAAVEDVRKIALCMGWWSISNDIISPSITAMEIEQVVQNLTKNDIKVQVWMNPEANSRTAELNKILKHMTDGKNIETVDTLARIVIGFIITQTDCSISMFEGKKY